MSDPERVPKRPSRTGPSRDEFGRGVKAAFPLLLGVAPFGMIVGVSATSAGLSTVEASAMSIMVFAGASQLAALELIGAGAAAPIVWLTAALINARFLMYSASLAPHWQRLSLGWRSLMAYVLTDQAYALAIIRYDQHGPSDPRGYYLGLSLVLWLTWQTTTIAGAVLGARIPERWSLDFAVPLIFLSLLAPVIRDRAGASAAASAGIVAVVAMALPFNMGLLVAALSGIGVGTLVEAWRSP